MNHVNAHHVLPAWQSHKHLFMFLFHCMVSTEIFTLYIYHVSNRRQMEISQKTAEEEERYKKEMEKYALILCLKYSLSAKSILFWHIQGKISCICHSVGLRLRRGSSTKSGKRTGEPKTGPRAPRAPRALGAPTLHRAHPLSHLRKKPPQRPRAPVRTPKRVLPWKAWFHYLLLKLFTLHLICLFLCMLSLSLSLPVTSVCCVAFYGLSSQLRKPAPLQRKTRRKSRIDKWVWGLSCCHMVFVQDTDEG